MHLFAAVKSPVLPILTSLSRSLARQNGSKPRLVVQHLEPSSPSKKNSTCFYSNSKRPRLRLRLRLRLQLRQPLMLPLMLPLPSLPLRLSLCL
jgi:hypothetical protein